jgi:hypothetical protein
MNVWFGGDSAAHDLRNRPDYGVPRGGQTGRSLVVDCKGRLLSSVMRVPPIKGYSIVIVTML